MVKELTNSSSSVERERELKEELRIQTFGYLIKKEDCKEEKGHSMRNYGCGHKKIALFLPLTEGNSLSTDLCL